MIPDAALLRARAPRAFSYIPSMTLVPLPGAWMGSAARMRGLLIDQPDELWFADYDIGSHHVVQCGLQVAFEGVVCYHD